MAWEPELGVGPGLTASSASELGGSSSSVGGEMQGHSDSPHIIQVHSIRHNKRAKCAHLAPFLHWLTASLKPRLRAVPALDTGPSPEGIPTAMQSGEASLRPRGPVPHGGEWGIKQDQRWAQSTEGGTPGRMWGLWG